MRVAAAAVIVAGFGAAAAKYLTSSTENSYSTPVGGHKIITFRTERASNLIPTLCYGLQAQIIEPSHWFMARRISRYHHDAIHPFAVNARGYRITDLGTKFTIRAELTGSKSVFWKAVPSSHR